MAASVMPQYYGKRFNAVDYAFRDPQTGEVVSEEVAAKNPQKYEMVENQIDPYQINPMYDIGAAAATTAPLLAHKFKEDPLRFDRPAPGYVSYENAREQARKDATVARNVGLQNLKNISSGGGAAANALALQTGLQGNLNRSLTASQEAEANRNAAIFGQNQMAKANIGMREDIQNYQDRRYVDEGNFQTASTVGRNVGNLIDRLKQNELLELEMQSYNPDYMFDKDGKYIARRSKQYVPREITTTPTVADTPTTSPINSENYTPGSLLEMEGGFKSSPIDVGRSDYNQLLPDTPAPIYQNADNQKQYIPDNIIPTTGTRLIRNKAGYYVDVPVQLTKLPIPDPYGGYNANPDSGRRYNINQYEKAGYVFGCGGKLKKRN
jgi:hypothetical protein